MSQNNNIYNSSAREDTAPRASPHEVGLNVPQAANPPHIPNQALHVHDGRQAQAPTPHPQLAPHVLQGAAAHMLRQNGAPTPQPLAQNQNLGAFGNAPRAIATPASQPGNAQPANAQTPHPQLAPNFAAVQAAVFANYLRQNGAPTPQPLVQNQNLGAFGHPPRAVATPAPQPANAQPRYVQPTLQILQETALRLLGQNGAPTPQPISLQKQNVGPFGHAPHVIATPASPPANARPANAQTPHPQLAPHVFQAAHMLRQNGAPTPQPFSPQIPNLGAFGHAPRAIATPAPQPANTQSSYVQPAPHSFQATALHLLGQNEAPTPQPISLQNQNSGAFGNAPRAIATPASPPANARPANAQTPHPQLAPNFEAVQAAVVANFLRHVAPTPQQLAQNQNLGAFGHAPHAIATPALQPANSLQPLRMDPASFAAMRAFFQQILQPQFNHEGFNAPNAVQIPLNPALVPARLPMTKDQIIQDANAWNANLIIDWNNMRKNLEDANAKNEKLSEEKVCHTEEINELKDKLEQEGTRHKFEIGQLQEEATQLQKDQEERHKAREAKLLEEKAELQKNVEKLMVDRKVFSAVFSGTAGVFNKDGDKPSTSDTVNKIMEQGILAIMEEIKQEKMESGQKRSADDKTSPVEKKKVKKQGGASSN